MFTNPEVTKMLADERQRARQSEAQRWRLTRLARRARGAATTNGSTPNQGSRHDSTTPDRHDPAAPDQDVHDGDGQGGVGGSGASVAPSTTRAPAAPTGPGTAARPTAVATEPDGGEVVVAPNVEAVARAVVASAPDRRRSDPPLVNAA